MQINCCFQLPFWGLLTLQWCVQLVLLFCTPLYPCHTSFSSPSSKKHRVTWQTYVDLPFNFNLSTILLSRRSWERDWSKAAHQVTWQVGIWTQVPFICGHMDTLLFSPMGTQSSSPAPFFHFILVPPLLGRLCWAGGGGRERLALSQPVSFHSRVGFWTWFFHMVV